MPTLSTRLILLLFIGILLCEFHGAIFLFWPETANIKYNLWLDKSYKENITVLWYTYELGNILDRVIWAYVLCKIAEVISYKLFKVCIVFFVYYITQFAFYVWNRGTSYFANYMVYLYMACIIIILLIPDKKTGKFISIDDY